MTMELLDDELTLDPDGHLSEVGASTLADGQHELLSTHALQHALACPECSLRLGEQALRSLDAQLALDALTAATSTASATAPAASDAAVTAGGSFVEAGPSIQGAVTGDSIHIASAPLPWWALAAAASVAVVGLLPRLLSPETHEGARTLLRITPALLLALRQTLQGPEVAAAVERASWLSAAALWAAGVALAWYATRVRREKQGETP